MMLPEKTLENKVKQWLQSIGVYDLGTPPEKMPLPPIGYYEKRWGGGMSKSGLPDMHIVINGINLELELKAQNGKATDLQKFMIRQINESGSLGMILYPAGFPAFQGIVKEVMNQCSLVIPALSALKAAHSSTNCATLTG